MRINTSRSIGRVNRCCQNCKVAERERRCNLSRTPVPSYSLGLQLILRLTTTHVVITIQNAERERANVMYHLQVIIKLSLLILSIKLSHIV